MIDRASVADQPASIRDPDLVSNTARILASCQIGGFWAVLGRPPGGGYA